MMQAFRDASPSIHLTPLSTTIEKGEQEENRILFAGSVIALRKSVPPVIRIRSTRINSSAMQCRKILAIY